MIGASVVLGCGIGSLCGGVFMKIGRRKALFITYAIALFGLMVSCYENFIVINIGRFWFGLSSGL